MTEQAIFLAALDIADPTERAAYLDKACAGNPMLRQQVDELLAAHQRSGEFLDVPALEQVADKPRSPVETSAENPAVKADGEIELTFLLPPTMPGSLGRLGHYEIQEIIGRGGCGVVLKAFDEKLQRVVAIKVMASELAVTSPARKRFLREARAAAAIRHENVISLYAVEDQPIPYLVMEYISGQTLQQKLDQTGPLDLQEVLHIGEQVARGLDAAHAFGLIHRDIKPANILLEVGRSQIKITDFGLARTADDASVTQSGTIAGTPLYMSPEQALGEAIDPRSDLFSLGSVMYVMCSGRPPFRAANSLAVLKRVAEDQPRAIQEIIPELPDWLCAIIVKLHAKNPADRFASAKEVADLLARCRSEMLQRGRVESVGDFLPMTAKPAPATPLSPDETPTSEIKAIPAPTSPPAPRRRRRWVAAAAILGLLLVGLGLTEATGVTHVRSTVIRLFSPAGTLVVEVDDPGVSVTIDGEDMVITGTGAKEIRLKPGQYKVLASRDGKVVRQELVNVTMNGRQVVRVTMEAAPDGKGPEPKTAPGGPPRYKNSLGMEFALVPKGKAWLGGGGGKPGDKEVEFKEDFYLGVYEVTQEEWEKVTGHNPSLFTRANGLRNVKEVSDEDIKRFPVEGMTWKDAQAFVARLNILCIEPGWVYRLPTEAEWEYACRGGPDTDHLESAFHFYFDKPSNTLQPGQANYSPNSSTPLKRTTRVGSYAPNRLGLHDMHGNVWEFCQDEITTPGKPDISHVQRGGCWRDFLPTATSRHVDNSKWRGFTLGLRVARVRADNPPRYKNSLGMEFALVPKGKAWLGGGGSKPGTKEVEFKEDFYLGVYEVTQENWLKVMGKNPSVFEPKRKDLAGLPLRDRMRFPVENISWDDAQEFIRRINETSRETGWIYRLPTETEWEYGCRGGPMIAPSEGAFDYYLDLPRNQLAPLKANFRFTGSANRPGTVGAYPPNKLGLHDMHGNVWEWCEDSQRDPRNELHRIFRGGAWNSEASICVATSRSAGPPTGRSEDLGLRLARVRVSESPTYKNALGMEFALVPKGKSWLGGGGGKPGTKEVEFKEDFYLGVYEVTQEEWEKITGLTPSYHARTGAGRDLVEAIPDNELRRFPVENVSYEDIQLFLGKLNESAIGTGWTYRLPTQEEWEYACRGGPMRSPLESGFDAYFDKPTNQLTPALANFGHPKGLKRTCRVGSYPPNPLGLYDMIGNVWEMCETIVTDDKVDPGRRLRGGYFNDTPKYCRAAGIGWAVPKHRAKDIGFRVARVRVADPDRRAAEWVLSIGGGVKVDGGLILLKTKEELPKEPFRLTTVGLPWNQKTTDKGWANLEGCQHVTMIELPYTPVTDAGIAYFKDCKGLVHLNLVESRVTDVGLAAFKDRPELQSLHIRNNLVTDAGLEYFKDCKKLRVLDIRCPKVTDAGLAYFKGRDLERLELTGSAATDRGLVTFKDCVNLTWLDVCNTQISDDGLAHFKDCKKLGTLYAFGTDLTDAALVHLKGCRNLSKLELDRTRVTGSGLGNLKDCNLTLLSLTGTPFSDQHIELLGGLFRLKTIRLKGTKVTEAGVKKLAALLPHCTIDWNGGVIAPQPVSADPGRRAAEWVLSIGGNAHVRQGRQEHAIHKLDALPAGPLELLAVALPQNVRATDAGLAQLKGCDHLFWLELSGSPIGDAGLAQLKYLPNLSDLGLSNTQVTDAGLAYLKDFKNLYGLNLGRTAVTGDGLSHLKGQKRLARLILDGVKLNDAGFDRLCELTTLTELNLHGVPVTNANLTKLTSLKNLTVLILSQSKVTDAGLAPLASFNDLGTLGLAETAVTDAGMVHVGKLSKLTWLELNKTGLTDEGMAHLKNLKNLTLVNLTGTKVTDAGLEHFKEMKKIEGITLIDTKVSDACLDILAGWPNLSHVRMQGTKVSTEGAKKLAAMLPRCSIEWDGGVIAPQTATTDR